MPLVEVASENSLKENVPMVVSAAGREIALFKHRGKVHALRNVCPHQTSSFVGGYAADERLPGGTRTEVVIDQNQPIVACPWHRWHFSLLSGVCTVDVKLRVKVYPVTVEDGRVLIEIGREVREEAAV